MKNFLFIFVFCSILLLPTAVYSAEVFVDDFNTEFNTGLILSGEIQDPQVPLVFVNSTTTLNVSPNGFNRFASVTKNAGDGAVSAVISLGKYSYNEDANTAGNLVLNYNSATPVDLIDGTNIGLAFSFTGLRLSNDALPLSDFTVTASDGVNSSTQDLSGLFNSSYGGSTNFNFLANFSLFAGVNFSNITTINISLNPTLDANDFQLGSISGVGAVPEPGTFALLGFLSTAFALRSRRKNAASVTKT